MNKSLIWIIVAVLVVAGGIYFFTGSESTEETKNTGASQIEEIPTSEFTDLSTSDDDFSEIDNALDVLG